MLLFQLVPFVVLVVVYKVIVTCTHVVVPLLNVSLYYTSTIGFMFLIEVLMAYEYIYSSYS